VEKLKKQVGYELRVDRLGQLGNVGAGRNKKIGRFDKPLGGNVGGAGEKDRGEFNPPKPKKGGGERANGVRPGEEKEKWWEFATNREGVRDRGGGVFPRMGEREKVTSGSGTVSKKNRANGGRKKEAAEQAK